MIFELLRIRWLRYGLIAAAVALVLVVAYRLLTMGVVEVETGTKNAEIFLIKGPVDNEQSRDKIGKGSAKKRVKPGLYTVHAKSADGAETKVGAEVFKRQTTKKSLSFSKLMEARELAQYTAYSITRSGDTFRFLNKGVDSIYEYTAGQSSGKEIFTDLFPVSAVRWVNYNNALVQLRDGTLRTIVNGAVSSLANLPPPADDDVPLITDISAAVTAFDVNDGGAVAVMAGSSVYYYAGLTSQPKLVAKGQNPASEVVLSNSGLVLLIPEIAEGSDTSEDAAGLRPVVVNTGDGEVNTLDAPNAINTVFGSWSADGTKLLYGSESATGVYDLVNNEYSLVSSVIPTNIGSSQWLDNENLLLVDSSAIWEYRLGDGQLRKLANSVGDILQGDAFGVEANRVWFGTTPKGVLGNGGLYEFTFDR